MSIPNIGDKIYVDTIKNLSTRKTYNGGWATVSNVETFGNRKNGAILKIEQIDQNDHGNYYNWLCLFDEQEELKDKYGDTEVYISEISEDEYNEICSRPMMA